MDDSDLLEQLDGHLSSPNMSWLLGAGISRDAHVPLMYPLTDRVMAEMARKGSTNLRLVQSVRVEMPDQCHVEHLLSHLGDYAALADRSKAGAVSINGATVTRAEIEAAHTELVNSIAETVRWGYEPANPGAGTGEKIGSSGASITDVKFHCDFVEACFNSARAGLNERRSAVRFFTTNYDTLLEDALALKRIRCWDGFDGGAVAFRSYRLGDGEPPSGYSAHLIKLHGSIDWHLNIEDGRVYKVRHGDSYPASTQRVLIYPQSTKYLAAQRDPFSAQFELFRRALTLKSDNTVAVCGYSFGDDHINQEMEVALSRTDSKSTLVAFCLEVNGALPECIESWRHQSWGSRVYVVTDKGLYVGGAAPEHVPATGSLKWWTFEGVSKALRNGLGSLL
jgi:hypothetical protein